jgi:formamidopyrimidine-DNA glycosylase
MPELPEVETIVRQLADHLPSLRIADVRIAHPDLIREAPESFRQALNRAEFVGVSRRGKNVVFELSGGQILLVNLGMTGRLLFEAPGEDPETPPHCALTFSLLPGGTLYYADARRFGRLLRLTPEEWIAESGRLGPEPLGPDLTEARFFEGTSRSKSPIRSWLLDQTRIAGIGNIYANEALFRSQVHPTRPACSLSETETALLLASIRIVLKEAIDLQGTTLQDYRTAEGGRGDFGPLLRVYGREGSPCSVCETAVARTVFGNRSAFFCPKCQQEASSSEL